MIKNKIKLHDQQDIRPFEKVYHQEIDFLITSSKELSEGTIILSTKTHVYIDFGIKHILKVSRKSLITNFVQTYSILNRSYLLTTKVSTDNSLSKDNLKDWVKKKLQKGNKVRLITETIDSLRNIHSVNLKKTLEYIKYTKFFAELHTLKVLDLPIKGFILSSIKGGFSVAIGGLITFLPAKELLKKPNKKLSNNFLNSSMNFKVATVNLAKKNVVLRRA